MKQNQTTKVQPKKYIQFSPKNEEQAECAELIENNDIIIVMGKSGSGKSHISAGVAAKYIKNKWVEKIILCRGAIGAEDLGYMPGNSVEKVGLYLSPILNELNYFLDVETMMKLGKIEIQPVLSMRGMTFKNSLVVTEEFQNLSARQLKLVLTRFGSGSKMILTGDICQSDLGERAAGEAVQCIDKLKTIATPENRIAIIELQENVRHPIINLLLSVL